MAILAASRHGFHGGIGILALLVLAGLVYGLVRMSQRRAAHPKRTGRGAAQAAPTVTAPDNRGHGPAVNTAGQHGSGGDARPVRPDAGSPGARVGASERGWAVETHGLTKRFGATAAVDNVDLLVPRGSAFGYLGPNGAGKTTLIRTLLGLTRADTGTMSLLGVPVPSQRSRALRATSFSQTKSAFQNKSAFCPSHSGC